MIKVSGPSREETPLPEDWDTRLRLVRLPGLGAPLRLLTPPSVDAMLERMDTEAPDAEEKIPYWAEIWPSAEAMARWLLAARGPRRPGRALEIGCGLGLLGIVALRLGWDLTLSDKDPEACRWTARNLARNGLDLGRVRRLDWRDRPADRWDTILASDILYERSFAPDLRCFLGRALKPGGRAYLAEPGRPVSEPALSLFADEFGIRILPARARGANSWRPVRIVEIHRS